MKLTPEDVLNAIDGLDAWARENRAVIMEDERISRPYKELDTAARVKLERVSEGRAVEKIRERAS